MFYQRTGNSKKTAKTKKQRSMGNSASRFLRSPALLLEPLEPRLLMDAYSALQRSTELQYWDPTRAENGYNFYGVSGTSYLLDMEGRVLHTWPVGNNPHLLSDGSVLDTNTVPLSEISNLIAA